MNTVLVLERVPIQVAIVMAVVVAMNAVSE